MTFDGLRAYRNQTCSRLRERRVGVSKENVYDPVKVRAAMRVIKELLAASGHPNATSPKRPKKFPPRRSPSTSRSTKAIARVVEIQ